MIHNMIVGGRRNSGSSGDTGFKGYLFNNGNVNTNITGGWIDYTGADITGDTITGASYGLGTNGGYCWTKNKVNISGCTKLKANVIDVQTMGALAIATDQYDSNIVTYAYFSELGEVELDISAVEDGAYYIGAYAHGTAQEANAHYTINQVWLE
jgi:hypothetical protein